MQALDFAAPSRRWFRSCGELEGPIRRKCANKEMVKGCGASGFDIALLLSKSSRCSGLREWMIKDGCVLRDIVSTGSASPSKEVLAWQ